MGQKFLLLHSYRDGTGRVCQRRLAHFGNLEEARSQLADPAWQQTFQQRYPDLPFDAPQLCRKAKLLQPSEPPKRQPYLRLNQQKADSALKLLRRLAKQNPDIKARIASELLQITQPLPQPREVETRVCVRQTEPPARARWESHDPEPERKALEELAELLQREGRLEESCQIQARLVAQFPGEKSWADYGEVLQRLGRADQAVQQYSKLPLKKSLRHYQIASVLIGQQKLAEGLQHLSLGMNRNRDIADALVLIEKGRKPHKGGAYWERYGHLWEAPARRFFLAVYKQPLVKLTLARAENLGVHRRRLFGPHASAVVLGRAQEHSPA